MWNTISHIADVLGIFSFILSLGIIRKIYAKAETQKITYQDERNELLNNLRALQQNIWDDGLTSPKIRDTLQSKVFEYQMKYLFISSFRCIFHAFRCTLLLNSGITEKNKNKIQQDINFLIARLTKKE